MPTVNIPGVGLVNFPDTMAPAEIDAAAKRLHDEAATPSPLSVTRQQHRVAPGYPSHTEGIARSFLQGATAGWSDEIGAGGAAIIDKLLGSQKSISDLYRDYVENNRTRQEAYNSMHPVASAAAEIGGGVTGAALLPGVKGATGLLARVGVGAGNGAAQGAVYGAGKAEDNSLYRALSGAVTGAGIGGAIPVAGELVSKLSPVLKRSAANNYYTLLAPTQAGVDTAKEIAPVLAETGKPAMSHQQLVDRLNDRADTWGQRVGAMLKGRPEVPPRRMAQLVDAVDGLRSQQSRLASDPTAIINEPLDAAITDTMDQVMKTATPSGGGDPLKLQDLKSLLWKGNVGRNGMLTETYRPSVAGVEKSTAGKIKGLLDDLYPDTTVPNTMYRANKQGANMLEAAQKAREANVSNIMRGNTQGFGGMLKSLTGPTLAGAGMGYMAGGGEGALLGAAASAGAAAATSTARHTTMSYIKQKIADLIANGRVEEAMNLSRLAAIGPYAGDK